jgi:predicted nucleic acid-binding Zn ribbon protein
MYYFSNYLTDEQLEAAESKGTCPVCKKNQIRGRQTKYCGTECRIIAHNQKFPKPPVDRNCVQCSVEFTGTGFFCSDECAQQNRQKKHQNPFSEYGTKGNKKQKKAKHKQEVRYGLGDPTWMDGSFVSNIPDNVRYIVASIPDEPYMQEDMQEIDKIIIEELSPVRAQRVRIRKSPKQVRRNRIQRAKKALGWEKGLKFNYKKKKFVSG